MEILSIVGEKRIAREDVPYFSNKRDSALKADGTFFVVEVLVLTIVNFS